MLFCDEAQRLSKHALEWLRDVHDQLAQQGVRLVTFLVGQPQLTEHKAQYQLAGDEQIVARFMIEQLNFRDTQPASISQKRFTLARRISEQLQLRAGHIVVLFCDEAQIGRASCRERVCYPV